MLVLAHASLGVVGAASFSHDQLGTLEHAHALHEVDHGHSHDDEADDPDAYGGAHTHSHDATDHSHDKSNMPPRDLARLAIFHAAWGAVEMRQDYSSPCSLPERPPKTLPLS